MQEAIKQKRKSKVKKDHWMDHAEDRFGAEMVSDVKAVLRICIIFLMYPLFWALYDQQVQGWSSKIRIVVTQYLSFRALDGLSKL